MGFQSKHPDLLGEQYRNCDEIARLGSAERSLSLQLDAVRERRHQLRVRNEEICFKMRPDRDRNVTRVDFGNRIRHEVTYQSVA
jgi:hypothetical protein